VELDVEFREIYYNTRSLDNLNEFSDLPDPLKVEILIKIFFYVDSIYLE
jgi:hypothetical protein